MTIKNATLCQKCLRMGVPKKGAQTYEGKDGVAHIVTSEGSGHVETACGAEPCCENSLKNAGFPGPEAWCSECEWNGSEKGWFDHVQKIHGWSKSKAGAEWKKGMDNSRKNATPLGEYRGIKMEQVKSDFFVGRTKDGKPCCSANMEDELKLAIDDYFQHGGKAEGLGLKNSLTGAARDSWESSSKEIREVWLQAAGQKESLSDTRWDDLGLDVRTELQSEFDRREAGVHLKNRDIPESKIGEEIGRHIKKYGMDPDQAAAAAYSEAGISRENSYEPVRAETWDKMTENERLMLPILDRIFGGSKWVDFKWADLPQEVKAKLGEQMIRVNAANKCPGCSHPPIDHDGAGCAVGRRGGLNFAPGRRVVDDECECKIKYGDPSYAHKNSISLPGDGVSRGTQKYGSRENESGACDGCGKASDSLKYYQGQGPLCPKCLKSAKEMMRS